MASRLTTEQEEQSYRRRLQNALDDLENLPPNWNGYGAEIIDRDIIESARRVVDQLPTDMVEPPKVVPMTRGRLQFEWHRGSRSLELEFETPESIHFLKWDSDRRIDDENVIATADVEEITRLMNWFASE
jgi:hypothetical protein